MFVLIVAGSWKNGKPSFADFGGKSLDATGIAAFFAVAKTTDAAPRDVKALRPTVPKPISPPVRGSDVKISAIP